MVKDSIFMSNSEKFSFNAQIGKVLSIMINSLYTNKDVFLRELISNASDACEKLRYESISNPNLLSENPELEIRVRINRENKSIEIYDTGIGMNKEDMINNLGTIAKSGTEEFIKAISESKEKSSDLIGQFGVGFYSSFMIASKVSVTSKKAGDKIAYKWTSNGVDDYEINLADESASRGTKIEVFLKPEDEEYLDKFKIRNIIESYSGNIGFPIMFEHEDGQFIKINKDSAAIWTKDKSKISNEEYTDFFKSKSHLPGDPYLVMHNNIEGNINYTTLIFIPSIKPFDLYNPDRSTKIQLYIKKVFISEKIDLLPKYLRFIYGVIDSPDLPLNISRETLQENVMIRKIKELTVKRVLSELKKKKDENIEEYQKFWNNFGTVLKEGLCEYDVDKDGILDISLFRTTKTDGKYITLQEYVDRMKTNQKEIYFFIGENENDVYKNPQLESFYEKDIEVLLMSDYVDNFWVNNVRDYKGCAMKSISHSDIDLSGIESINKSDKVEEKNDDAINSDIIKYFTEALSGRVKSVKVSNKLKNSPACISIDAGMMDIKMEQMMIMQGQIKSPSLKIFELNPHNKTVLQALNYMKNGDEKGKEIAIGLLEIASIAQGDTLQNPSEFANRVFAIIGSNYS
jgi:molecular chaperone HtpG